MIKFRLMLIGAIKYGFTKNRVDEVAVKGFSELFVDKFHLVDCKNDLCTLTSEKPSWLLFKTNVTQQIRERTIFDSILYLCDRHNIEVKL